MPNSNITEDYSKIKFQSIDEKKSFCHGFYDPWLFLCLQQVSIWFSIVRICPLKRWSYFVFAFYIAFESMWRFESVHGFASVGNLYQKCISPVRICLQTENARNASAKFRKTSESKRFSEKFGLRRM